MLEIVNTRVYGLEESIARSGLPKRLGRPNLDDLLWNASKRMRRLGRVPTGTGHDCALKGIIVQCDMRVSGYIVQQLLRYRFLDVVSSQSKMVSLRRADIADACNAYVDPVVVERVKVLQAEYNARPTYENRMRLLSSCPLGYEHWMGVSTNLLQLKTIYHQRKSHRLKEDWGYFCRWCEGVPGFSDFVLGVDSEG